MERELGRARFVFSAARAGVGGVRPPRPVGWKVLFARGARRVTLAADGTLRSRGPPHRGESDFHAGNAIVTARAVSNRGRSTTVIHLGRWAPRLSTHPPYNTGARRITRTVGNTALPLFFLRVIFHFFIILRRVTLAYS